MGSLKSVKRSLDISPLEVTLLIAIELFVITMFMC